MQLEKILAQRVNIALFDILLLDQFADLVFNVLILFCLFFRPIRNVDECKCQNRGVTSVSTLAAFCQLDLSTTMILSCQLMAALSVLMLADVAVLLLPLTPWARQH